jgi:hypothetical protein
MLAALVISTKLLLTERKGNAKWELVLKKKKETEAKKLLSFMSGTHKREERRYSKTYALKDF